MKQTLKHEYLPWLTLLCGGIGLMLRLWLLTTEDSKGFILRGHISELLLLCLTAVVLVVLFFACRGLQQGNKYDFNFPPSRIAALGSGVFALVMALISVADVLSTGDRLHRICGLLGIMGAVALAVLTCCRLRGKQPGGMLHALVCCFLTLRLICLYRGWSADPQLEDYGFALMALVFAMLASYERAAFDADFGNRGRYTFFALAAVYFCCISLAGNGDALFYGGMGLWLMTNLCSLLPMMPAPQEPEEV